MSALDAGTARDASFLTLKRPSRAETKERGSRFIATACPARDASEARAALEAARSEFPDATHHCWAYSLQSDARSVEERFHDAGEPRGTAGPPILQAIRSARLSNVVVVVTRYFGGTKLGKGGLARAYRAAAAKALESVPTVAVVVSRRISISVPLTLDGEARHLVARHGGQVERSIYEEAGRSVLHASVPAGRLSQLHEDLQAAARGEAHIQDLDAAI